MNGSANVSPVYGATLYETAVTAATAHSATMSATTTSTGWSLPASTMVGSPNGLQFDLTWDSSVASAPPGFIQAVTAAAKVYTELFSNKEVINLDIGYGEVDNIQLPVNYLGATLNYSMGPITQPLRLRWEKMGSLLQQQTSRQASVRRNQRGCKDAGHTRAVSGV
jgi:hypothetical protein